MQGASRAKCKYPFGKIRAGLLRELLCSVMHCPAIGATGAPIDFNEYNWLQLN